MIAEYSGARPWNSALEANRRERQHTGERVVVSVDVEDAGLVLLRACGDEQIGDRYPMLRLRSELALCRLSRRDRLSVNP